MGDALLETIRRRDRAFGGWRPGIADADRETRRLARDMLGRRPRGMDAGRTLLPSTTARRYSLIRDLDAETLWIHADADGLSVLLARDAQVTVRQPEVSHRLWLEDEARRADVSDRLSFEADPPTDGRFDVAVVAGEAPGVFEATLNGAVAATRAGGSVVVDVHVPWERHVHEVATRAGLSVRRCEREVSHTVLPGGMVLDGGGDLLILDRPATARPVEVARDGAAMENRPSFSVECHTLDAASLDRHDLTDLARLLRSRLGGEERAANVTASEERQVLAWYGSRGEGLTAELHPRDRRLWLEFMPYDGKLELAALAAAEDLFAGDATRTRPRRTERTGDREVFRAGPRRPEGSRLEAVAALAEEDGPDRIDVAADGVAEVGCHRLADGLVLALLPRGAEVVDLAHRDRLTLGPDHVDFLDGLARGTVPDGLQEVVPRLVAAGAIVADPEGVDAVLRRGLTRLDSIFLEPYRDHLGPRDRRAHEAVLDAHARRKRFDIGVGQCPTLPETALRRALAVGDAEDVGSREVLCVGDDDLVSVALATLGHRVTVMDIDEHVLEMVRRTARDRDLAIDLESVDLRDPVPSDRREAFDVVLTDPVSSRACLELFLSRGFAMLRPEGTLFTAVFPPAQSVFHDLAGEMAFAVENREARSGRYYTHRLTLHGYESDWIRTRKTARTRCSLDPEDWCQAMDLYDESATHRMPSYVECLDGIPDMSRALPLDLDLLLDVLEKTLNDEILDRWVHAGEGWSALHRVARDGHIAVHADRRRRQISFGVHPHRSDVRLSLQLLLRSVFRPKN